MSGRRARRRASSRQKARSASQSLAVRPSGSTSRNRASVSTACDEEWNRASVSTACDEEWNRPSVSTAYDAKRNRASVSTACDEEWEHASANLVCDGERFEEAVDEIRVKLIETGDMDRLKELLERRLNEAEWRLDMMEKLREVAQIKGRNTTFEMLFQSIREEGQYEVPELIRRDMIRYIRIAHVAKRCTEE